MTSVSYAEAVTHGLDRLRDIGFEHGSSGLVNHAPMAAEAIAHAGYADTVPAWIDRNLKTRRYHAVPEARAALDPRDETDWLPAIGDFTRVTDWTMMFEREMADRDWRDVMGEWWLRLLPGMAGSLTHGLIRTAHAARALAAAGDGDPLLRQELARGLAYWATRYSGPRPVVDAPDPPGPPAEDGAEVIAALDRLVADNAGIYAELRSRHPVPLIHAITAPAAVRLAAAYLPAHALRPSYETTLRCCEQMRGWFGGTPRQRPTVLEETSAAESQSDLMAAAVELGDEHAIKLTEVAVRHQALFPDPRYAAAARWAIEQIGRIT